MIIHYTVKENIFAVIINKLLVRRNIKTSIKDCCKINGKPRMPKKVNILNLKLLKDK